MIHLRGTSGTRSLQRKNSQSISEHQFCFISAKMSGCRTFKSSDEDAEAIVIAYYQKCDKFQTNEDLIRLPLRRLITLQFSFFMTL